MFGKKIVFLTFLSLLFFIGCVYALETPSDMSTKAKKFLREKNFSASMKYAEKLKKAKPKFHEGYQLAGLSFYGIGKYAGSSAPKFTVKSVSNGQKKYTSALLSRCVVVLRCIAMSNILCFLLQVLLFQ